MKRTSIAARTPAGRTQGNYSTVEIRFFSYPSTVKMLSCRVHARHCPQRDEQTRVVRIGAEHHEVNDEPPGDAEGAPAKDLTSENRPRPAPGRSRTIERQIHKRW